MHVVYTGEEAPSAVKKSIFLAGPSPRRPTDPNWREDAIVALERMGYDGVVYAPIWRGGPPSESGKPFNYDGQVKWETRYLNECDVIVFWVPRDMKTLPALTTNVEFGMWLTSGKVVLGYPEEAEHMKYMDWWAKQENVPIHDSLYGTLATAVAKLGDGAPRSGGERDIPLHVWNRQDFKTWYAAQKGVGNRLDGAKVLWSFRVGNNRVFMLSLHVNVYIKRENRNKINEFVLFRPDISTIVAYCPPGVIDGQLAIPGTEVVLIKEFRSPANNPDAMVYEVPGGSSPKPGVLPGVTASEEFHEETGLKIQASRFRHVGVRQVAATAMAFRAHCYAVELLPVEMEELKAEMGEVAHGNHGDSEYTFVLVSKVSDMLKNPNIDWSNIGMVYQALSQDA